MAAHEKLSQAHSELEALVSKLSERNSKLGTDLHSRETEASIAQGAAGSNPAGSCLLQADRPFPLVWPAPAGLWWLFGSAAASAGVGSHSGMNCA